MQTTKPENRNISQKPRQTLNKGLLCSEENPIGVLKNWRTWAILEGFVAFYVGVLLVYLGLARITFPFMSFWGNILAYSTSPFNFLEIFSSTYSSPLEGYLLNGVFTVAIIFAATIYFGCFAPNRRLKPKYVFLARALGQNYFAHASVVVMPFR